MMRKKMVTRTTPALALALALGISSCGYFNSLYNARRQFADAERARRAGDVATARGAYVGSIEKAAKSYRRYPNGRWADDALMLIARSHFEIGEYPAARAALAQLLASTDDEGMRADAQAFAGATEVSMAAPAVGLVLLDSAVASLGPTAALAGFARLWRARARAANDDVAGAWADLDAVKSPDDREFTSVQLERLALAIQSADTARVASAFASILGGHDARRQMDTISRLSFSAVGTFGPEPVRAMLVPSGGEWIDAARDSLTLLRAQIASRADDTLNSNRELLQLAGHASAGTAAAARIAVARARLRYVDKLERLPDIRALLLSALGYGQAQQLISAMRLVDVLVQQSAQSGQPLAFFTAAEIARDELGAPELARQLFIAYADLAPQTPWAGKALLAAIAIAPNALESNTLRDRVAALPPNPYTSLVRGEGALEAYESAEEKLDRAMVALRAEGQQLAQQHEGAVTRAVFVLDSIKLAARADTVRIGCGLMLDTLALTGIRKDSVQLACLRGEPDVVTLYLKADTMSWKARPAARDSVLRAKRRAVTKDSIN